MDSRHVRKRSELLPKALRADQEKREEANAGEYNTEQESYDGHTKDAFGGPHRELGTVAESERHLAVILELQLNSVGIPVGWLTMNRLQKSTRLQHYSVIIV